MSILLSETNREKVANTLPAHIRVWRVGFAPQYSTLALECLRAGLMADDPNLIQSATTVPPPLQCVADWPTEACDLVTYGIWKSSETDGTVGAIEAKFAEFCWQADQNTGHPGSCSAVLGFWDDSPREEARMTFLAEVVRELDRRNPAHAEAVSGEAVGA